MSGGRIKCKGYGTSRYVHLNPVKVKGKLTQPLSERIEYLRAYEWSSYRSYIRLAKRLEWVEERHAQLLKKRRHPEDVTLRRKMGRRPEPGTVLAASLYVSSTGKHFKHIKNNGFTNQFSMAKKEPPPVAIIDKDVPDFDMTADEFHRGTIVNLNVGER